MRRFILFLLLNVMSFSSFADFLYTGIEIFESSKGNSKKINDALVMAGIDVNISEVSSFSVDLGLNNPSDNNGVVLKTNILYNHKILKMGNFKPSISAGIFGILDETETCSNDTVAVGNGNFQQVINCSSNYTSSMGVVLGVSSEIKVSNNSIYLLKLFAAKDNKNNSFISLVLAKAF